jgi:hypothetical protein
MNMSIVDMNKTPIHINISVIHIDNLDETSMSYTIKILVELKWYDTRLTFYNLKSERAKVNSISAKVSTVGICSE